MRDQDPKDHDQGNDSGRNQLPSVHAFAECFPLLSETHFTELMKDDVERRGAVRRPYKSGTGSADRASGQIHMNRTAALVMLFGTFFGAFCLEPGTAAQGVLYGAAVALLGWHFVSLLEKAAG